MISFTSSALGFRRPLKQPLRFSVLESDDDHVGNPYLPARVPRPRPRPVSWDRLAFSQASTGVLLLSSVVGYVTRSQDITPAALNDAVAMMLGGSIFVSWATTTITVGSLRRWPIELRLMVVLTSTAVAILGFLGLAVS